MKLICGIVGSLRQGSFNRGLMNAAIEIGRDAGLDIQIFDRIGEIPIYNADLDTDDSLPEPVTALKSAIGSAAGLLIATPEYNYSVPGGLKNAFDWASRPAGKSPLNRKPAAIMGASTGMSGTIRAQLALRQSHRPINPRTDWQADAEVRDLDRRRRISYGDRRNLSVR